MCGRYASSRRPQDLVEDFDIEFTNGPGPGADPSAAEPDYNVAPTKAAMVVLERRPRTDLPAAGAGGDGGDEVAVLAAVDEDGEATVDAVLASAPAAEPDPVRWLRLFTWGLVPSWAKDRKIGSRMINARSESLLDKTFRRAALTRRCLVPADGWYEWQKSPTERDAKGRPRKQPFFMRPIAEGPIAFAGIYEFWRDPAAHPDAADPWLSSYAVVTTDAEPGLTAIHDRMPLVLPRERWNDWLDPQLQDEDAVRALMVAPVPGRFTAIPVSSRVNVVGNNGPELVAELPREQLRGVLDPATGELLGGGDVALF